MRDWLDPGVSGKGRVRLQLPSTHSQGTWGAGRQELGAEGRTMATSGPAQLTSS